MNNLPRWCKVVSVITMIVSILTLMVVLKMAKLGFSVDVNSSDAAGLESANGGQQEAGFGKGIEEARGPQVNSFGWVFW